MRKEKEVKAELTLVLPAWARWKATDTDGEVWVYSRKPEEIINGWDRGDPVSKMQKVCTIDPSCLPKDFDWRKSLVKIK